MKFNLLTMKDKGRRHKIHWSFHMISVFGEAFRSHHTANRIANILNANDFVYGCCSVCAGAGSRSDHRLIENEFHFNYRYVTKRIWIFLPFLPALTLLPMFL